MNPTNPCTAFLSASSIHHLSTVNNVNDVNIANNINVGSNSCSFATRHPQPFHSIDIYHPYRRYHRHNHHHHHHQSQKLNSTRSIHVPLSMISSTNNSNKTTIPVPHKKFDIVILGSGPAGLALAYNLSLKAQNMGLPFKMAIVDPKLDARWIPNYGVWIDEVDHLGFADCFKTTWDKTVVYVEADDRSSPVQKKVLQRPYARFDRAKLKKKLLDGCIQAGVEMFHAKATDLQHVDDHSSYLTLIHQSNSQLQNQDPPLILASTLVVDATGHAKTFLKYDGDKVPGVQAAYGIEAKVESHPFPIDEMLLMDYRDDFLQNNPTNKKEAQTIPTFLYAMPTDNQTIFLEETSLVARPPIDFDYLKDRLYKRLNHLGVRVTHVEEEEFCYIPMGISLPSKAQRLLGFGGSAGLVHSSTGYMIARTLNAADQISYTILAALTQYYKTTSHGQKHNLDHLHTSTLKLPNIQFQNVDQVAAYIWEALWSASRLKQKDFLDFGGEVLMQMNLTDIRNFFMAFFRLDVKIWAQFLSFGLINPQERLVFGLGVFQHANNRVRAMLAKNFVFAENPALLVKSVFPTLNTVNKKDIV